MHHGVHAHLHHRRQFGNFFGNGKDPIQEIGDEVGGFLTGKGNNNRNDNSDNGGNDNSNNNKQTKVSVVYYTPPPTFSGPIAGYSTMNGGDDTPSTRAPATSAAPKPTPSDDSSKNSSPTTIELEPTSSGKRSTSLVKSIRVTSDSTLGSATETIPSNAAASSTGTAGPQVTTSSNEMSTGAKAGIAIGVILGVLFLIGAAYAIYRHRQNQLHRAEESEKNPFGDHAASHHANPPPMVAAAAAVPVSRGVDTAHSNNPSNPFGNHAEPVQPVVPSGNSFAPPAAMADLEKAAAAAGIGAGAVVGVAAVGAAAAKHQNAPQPLDLNRSQSPALAAGVLPSPAASQFSNASMTSTAIAAGAPATNVHRVQMDFNPSMEDELELKAGQLVRVLHEYDDGWALCVRLDRSQQGVCPRTCLSTRPLKPRNGPPRGPGGPGSKVIPGSPQSARSQPAPVQTAYGQPRSMSPALNPNPAKRSMSPGPYGGGPQSAPNPPFAGRPRSNSAGDVRDRRNNLPGPSPMNPGRNMPAQGSPNITAQNAAPFNMPISITAGSIPNSPVTRKPVPNRSSS